MEASLQGLPAKSQGTSPFVCSEGLEVESYFRAVGARLSRGKSGQIDRRCADDFVRAATGKLREWIKAGQRRNRERFRLRRRGPDGEPKNYRVRSHCMPQL